MDTMEKLTLTLTTTIALMGMACVSRTQKDLRSLVGTNIGDCISRAHVYPDSVVDLPTGGKAYRFSNGSGGRVYQNGDFQSNVCTWWLETDSSGIITYWRYQNCE